MTVQRLRIDPPLQTWAHRRPRPFVVRAQRVASATPEPTPCRERGRLAGPPRGARGVAGPSGPGKTTLLRMLTGRLAPSVGRLEVGAEGIAWVSQRPYFFQASIAHNLPWRTRMPPRTTCGRPYVVGPGRGDGRIPTVCPPALAGAATPSRGVRLDRWPCPCTAVSAELLVLDEPTAHLDRVSEESLIETITALVPQHPVIVASHSPTLLSRCTSVQSLDIDLPGKIDVR